MAILLMAVILPTVLLIIVAIFILGRQRCKIPSLIMVIITNLPNRPLASAPLAGNYRLGLAITPFWLFIPLWTIPLGLLPTVINIGIVRLVVQVSGKLLLGRDYFLATPSIMELYTLKV